MSLSILTPLNLELPLRPQLNRRYPHELHWRAAAPKWGGNIKGAFANLYPGMMDGDCCFQCGAVPCPYDHETARQDRLKDLEFIKELAKDRREMKETIAKMKEELRMYEGMKRDWERERKNMDAELKRLQGLNNKQQGLLVTARLDQQKIVSLTKQVAELEAEREELKEENKKLRQMIVNQSNKMALIESQFDNMQRDLREATTKVRTVTVQLDESTEELQRVRKQLWDKEAQIKEMDDEITNLIGTLEVKTRTFQEKETESMDMIRELRRKINELKNLLDNAHQSNKDLNIQNIIYLKEIERLKQKMMSDQRFKQFVEIKRENNSLKGENEKLMVKVLESENRPPIPIMKKSGKVMMRKSRVMSAAGPRSVSSSSFSGEGKLRRPKSSNVRTLVARFPNSESEEEDDGQTSL